jgi:DNA-binding CsgD family transcriptional regulator
MLMSQLAIEGLYGMNYASMCEWTRRALAMARELDDPPLHVTIASLHGLAAVLDGEISEAEQACSEAACIADQMPDDELAPYIDNFGNLAAAEMYLDRRAEALVHAERCWALARATGRDRIVPLLFWLGVVRTGCGQLSEAGEVLDIAVEVARLSHHDQGMAWNLAQRSLSASAAGDVATAVTTAEEAVDAARRGGLGVPAVLSGLAMAGALLLAGEPERAIGVLQDSGGGDALDHLPPRWKPLAYELLTSCWVALGRHDEAAGAAERARASADRLGLPSALAIADRAGAAAALSSGDGETAESCAEAAAATFEETGAPVDAALARMLLATALSRGGRAADAVTELERAAAAFATAGATGRHVEAERALKLLRPRRTRRSPTADPAGPLASLTDRELEVARLMSDGLTNREIAAKLFVSRKTVETHLHNVFRKLDVTNRVDAARIVGYDVLSPHSPGSQ